MRICAVRDEKCVHYNGRRGKRLFAELGVTAATCTNLRSRSHVHIRFSRRGGAGIKIAHTDTQHVYDTNTLWSAKCASIQRNKIPQSHVYDVYLRACISNLIKKKKNTSGFVALSLCDVYYEHLWWILYRPRKWAWKIGACFRFNRHNFYHQGVAVYTPRATWERSFGIREQQYIFLTAEGLPSFPACAHRLIAMHAYIRIFVYDSVYFKRVPARVMHYKYDLYVYDTAKWCVYVTAALMYICLALLLLNFVVKKKCILLLTYEENLSSQTFFFR